MTAPTRIIRTKLSGKCAGDGAARGGGTAISGAGHDAPMEIERIHGACLMTRAIVLRQIGLLDEDFFMYDEDVDWCVRARKAGWRLLLLPNARVRHYGGKTSGRTPSGQRAKGAAGRRQPADALRAAAQPLRAVSQASVGD